MACIAAAATMLTFGCGSSGKAPEDNAPEDGKLDSFFSPTLHGTIALGEGDEGRLSDEEQFHAWDFELSGSEDVTLYTGETASGDFVDTVLYLYRRDENGSFGSYLARNDDRDEMYYWSWLHLNLDAGSYRIVVKGHRDSEQGVFGLYSVCDGAGCKVQAEAGLLVPVLDEDGGPLSATYANELEAAGLSPFPESIFVTYEVDFTDALEPLWDAEIEPMAFALPDDYAGLCFRGDGSKIADLAQYLADDVFSDQFIVFGSRFGAETLFADWIEVDELELPDAWKDYDRNSDEVLILYAYTDSGDETVPYAFRRCAD